MNKQSLEEKQAFAAKIRARNYAASLRLEGIRPAVFELPMTKESIISKYKSQISQ
ncbi:YhfG family protein [uncultured Tolumonas sp.]|uniref:YhfG family protein n=1 Tax=uncultured Tolumonas sp. TaxID=263765 RepID=UPI002A0A53EA|nr:YhfG family protein [uncultured Tolumonas sp.]